MVQLLLLSIGNGGEVGGCDIANRHQSVIRLIDTVLWLNIYDAAERAINTQCLPSVFHTGNQRLLVEVLSHLSKVTRCL